MKKQLFDNVAKNGKMNLVESESIRCNCRCAGLCFKGKFQKMLLCKMIPRHDNEPVLDNVRERVILTNKGGSRTKSFFFWGGQKVAKKFSMTQSTHITVTVLHAL